MVLKIKLNRIAYRIFYPRQKLNCNTHTDIIGYLMVVGVTESLNLQIMSLLTSDLLDLPFKTSLVIKDMIIKTNIALMNGNIALMNGNIALMSWEK